MTSLRLFWRYKLHYSTLNLLRPTLAIKHFWLKEYSNGPNIDNRTNNEKPPKDINSQSSTDLGHYQVEEYFNYNPHSYYDLEMTLKKYRLKQPKPGKEY